MSDQPPEGEHRQEKPEHEQPHPFEHIEKRVEEALRESEARFRAIFGGAGIGISLTSIEGRLVETNPVLQEMLGYTEEELRGMSFAELTHPDDLEANLELFREMAAGKCDHYQMEKRYIRKDGGIIWTRLVSSLVRDIDGNPQFSFGMMEDITERKRAEEKLQERETRFRALFENSPDAIFVEDYEGNVLDVNPAGCRLNNMEREELIGQNVLELVPPEAREEAALDFARMTGGEVDHVTGFSETPDGRVIPVEIKAGRIEYFGRPALLLHVRDVSERKKAEEEEKRLWERTQKQQATLARLTTHPALAEGRLDEALPLIAEAAAVTLEVERVSIWRLTRDGKKLRCLETYLNSTGGHSGGDVIVVEKYSDFFEALETGMVVDATDAGIDPRTAELYRDYLEEVGVRSCIDAPVRLHGRLMGLVCHGHVGQHRVWLPDETAFASRVADLVSQTFLHAETRQRLEEVTLLSRVITLTASADDLVIALRDVCAELARFFKVPQVGFGLIDRQHASIEIVAEHLAIGNPSSIGLVIPISGNPSMDYILEHKEPLAITDAQTDPVFASVHHIMRERGIKSMLLVPVLIDGEVAATVGFDSLARREFTGTEIILAKNVADQVGQVLKRKRAEEELIRRNRELTTLYEAATAISSDLALDVVLQTVAEQMAHAINAGGCALSLWHRERGVLEVLVDYSRKWPDEVDPSGTAYNLEDYPATRRALVEREPVLIQAGDPEADEGEMALIEELSLNALLMLPLVARDRVLGLVELMDDVEGREFTREDIRLARSMSAQAAIAIENAQLYTEVQQELTERKRAETALQESVRREMELAHRIQSNLLPQQPPRIPGLEIAARSMPARQVGGDFYRYLILADGSFGLAIGDVSGKGVPSALFMAMTITAVDTQIHEHSTPCSLLGNINRMLYQRMKANQMNTGLMVAIFDAPENGMNVANAGMIDPLVVGNGGSYWVEVSGLPIGSLPLVKYEAQKVSLGDGAKIVFASDGIVEAMNRHGEMFGFDRLQATVEDFRRESPQGMLDGIWEAVGRHIGDAEPHDDMTLLVVRTGL